MRDVKKMWEKVEKKILASTDSNEINLTYQDSDSEYTEIEELLAHLSKSNEFIIDKTKDWGIQIHGIRTSITYFVTIRRK